MRVIGTVGLAGSGKGEFATVAEELDIPVVTMGDVIRAECRERGLDPAEHHGQVAQALRQENGPAAIAEASLPHIEDASAESDTVLVDGIRAGAEVDIFEERFGDDFTLVSIEAPFAVREKRVNERGRDKVGEGGEGLAARDERELSFGLDEALARADLTIDNTGSLAEFRKHAQRILE
ncbi:MAG: dephospho-CoA kinase [Natronomonas sp.]|jgi:dephospho-CoA kinase|uniref:AAA family ATPase n=1 Tax=Natronomonas sp. TaxID=2184060 RepID=UPI003989B7E3